ncbi:hypothetical protein C8R47DRAFT_1228447 [Mycena vitilis]|nr:hypothetical protein C8R47DRAFT_1228447 [Mycena vitilis]
MGKRKATSPELPDKGKQICLRSSAVTVAQTFFLMNEVVVTHLLYQCDLLTLFTLAQCTHYARNLVKTFFRTNFRAMIEFFLGEHTDAFLKLLVSTLAGVAGSVATSVMTYPYKHDWMPADLNLYIARGTGSPWKLLFQNASLHRIGKQPGVERRFNPTVFEHTVYESVVPGFTIAVTESIDASIFTPLSGATSTFATNLITGYDLFALYPYLLRHSRALEGWFPTPVLKAVDMGRRRYRSSFSTASWDAPCGLHCPILFRYIKGLKGVGVFRWGGPKNKAIDGSEEGIPFTNSSVKWRLGDTCTNSECVAKKGDYYASLRRP